MTEEELQNKQIADLLARVTALEALILSLPSAYASKLEYRKGFNLLDSTITTLTTRIENLENS